MWKLYNNFKTEENFAKWATTTEKKVPKNMKEEFSQSWPMLQNANELVRGAFVCHWSLVMNKPISTVALPVTIGSLSYLQLAAHTIGRTDLVEILQAMMQNIPRIQHEIGSHKDEEE